MFTILTGFLKSLVKFEKFWTNFFMWQHQNSVPIIYVLDWHFIKHQWAPPKHLTLRNMYQKKIAFPYKGWFIIEATIFFKKLVTILFQQQVGRKITLKLCYVPWYFLEKNWLLFFFCSKLFASYVTSDVMYEQPIEKAHTKFKSLWC